VVLSKVEFAEAHGRLSLLYHGVATTVRETMVNRALKRSVSVNGKEILGLTTAVKGLTTVTQENSASIAQLRVELTDTQKAVKLLQHRRDVPAPMQLAASQPGAASAVPSSAVPLSAVPLSDSAASGLNAFPIGLLKQCAVVQETAVAQDTASKQAAFAEEPVPSLSVLDTESWGKTASAFKKQFAKKAQEFGQANKIFAVTHLLFVARDRNLLQQLSKSSILVAFEFVSPKAAHGCTSYKLDKQKVIKCVKKHLDIVYKTQREKKDKEKKVEKAKKRKARLRRREDGRGAPTGPTSLTHCK
jgi:hypothetical protein